MRRLVKAVPDVSAEMRSSFHGAVVKLSLYLIVWPNMVFTAIFTVVAVFAPPVMIMMIISWWGLGALLVLHYRFAGQWDRPGKAVWWGLALATALVVLIGYGGGVAVLAPSIYWLPASCVLHPCCSPLGMAQLERISSLTLVAGGRRRGVDDLSVGPSPARREDLLEHRHS